MFTYREYAQADQIRDEEGINMYKIQDREAGNVIDTGLTKAQAEAKLKEYELKDKESGDYSPDFYEIKEE
jgi:Tfp pilus assembly protein PilX